MGVVAFGTILGHGLCTFGAVMGGRWLSTFISVRHSKSSPDFQRAAFMLSLYDPQSLSWAPPPS